MQKVGNLLIELVADLTLPADANMFAEISFLFFFFLKKILVSPQYYLWLHYDPWEP